MAYEDLEVSTTLCVWSETQESLPTPVRTKAKTQKAGGVSSGPGLKAEGP